MHKDRTFNIIFCGIGGQGVLKAAEVAAWAAVYAGFRVKKSEVHGMAQRGGSVESHVRFGKEVFSPLVPQGRADFLVPFFKAEEERLRPFLKKQGISLLGALAEAESQCADKKYLNVFLLGRLSRSLPLPPQAWIRGLKRVFASKNFQENKRVFYSGRGEER